MPVSKCIAVITSEPVLEDCDRIRVIVDGRLIYECLASNRMGVQLPSWRELVGRTPDRVVIWTVQ